MFIGRDPIGLLGGVNVYQYADNPVQFIDPLELKRKTTQTNTSNTAKNDNGNRCQTVPKGKNIYYHYTTEANMNAILASKKLMPSLKASNPNDARYGDGQYLTDIVPNTKTNGFFVNVFYKKSFSRKKVYQFYCNRYNWSKFNKGQKSCLCNIR